METIKEIKNRNGLNVCVGKSYYYFNQGLGEIKVHYITKLDCVYATSYDGRVETDSLYETEEQVKIAKGYYK